MVQLFKFLFCLAIVWPNIWPMSDVDACNSSNSLQNVLDDLDVNNPKNLLSNVNDPDNFKRYLNISEKDQVNRLEILKKYAYEDNYLSFKANGLTSQSSSKITKDSQVLGFNSLSNFVAALIFYMQNSKEDLKLDQLLQYFTANQSVFQPGSNILLPRIVQKTVANIKAQPNVDFELVSRLEEIASTLTADCKSDFESSLYNDFILKIYLNYRYNSDFKDIIKDIIADLFKKLYIYQLITNAELKDSFNTVITLKYFRDTIINDSDLKELKQEINPNADLVNSDIDDQNDSNPAILPISPISYNPEDDLVTKLEQRILELVLDQVQEKLNQVFGIKLNSKDLDIAKDADSCLYFSKDPNSIMHNDSLISCRTQQTDPEKRKLFDNFLALWQVDATKNNYPVDLIDCVIDYAIANLNKIAYELQDENEDFQNPTTDNPNSNYNDILAVFKDFAGYLNFAHSLFLYNLATQLKDWQTVTFSSAKMEKEVKEDLSTVINDPKSSKYYNLPDQPITFENINLEQLNKIILVCNNLQTCDRNSHYSCTNNCIDYLLQQTSSNQDIFDQDSNLKKEFLDVVKQCSAKNKDKPGSPTADQVQKCFQGHAPSDKTKDITLINLVEKNIEKLKPSLSTSNQPLKMLALQAYLKAKKSETKKLPKVGDQSVCSDLNEGISNAELKYYQNLEKFFESSEIDSALFGLTMALPAFEKLYFNLKNYPQLLNEFKTNLQTIGKAIKTKLTKLTNYLTPSGQSVIEQTPLLKSGASGAAGVLEDFNTPLTMTKPPVAASGEGVSAEAAITARSTIKVDDLARGASGAVKTIGKGEAVVSEAVKAAEEAGGLLKVIKKFEK